MFRDALGGHALLSNKAAWGNYTRVSCRHWHYRNVVLLGDALRRRVDRRMRTPWQRLSGTRTEAPQSPWRALAGVALVIARGEQKTIPKGGARYRARKQAARKKKTKKA